MKKVEIELDALKKIIEIARKSDAVDIIDLLQIAGVKTDHAEKPKHTKRQYTKEEKEEFRELIRIHKKAVHVPNHVKEEVAQRMNRSEMAIYAQLIAEQKKAGY